MSDVDGLLTCGIVTLYYRIEEITKVEIRRDDQEFGKSLVFSPRGIGSDSCPCCFVCGTNEPSPVMSNIAAFVASQADGQEIVKWFNNQARLDFRQHQPNWIQVKVGTCKKHYPNLEILYERTKRYGRIREHDIEVAKETK